MLDLDPEAATITTETQRRMVSLIRLGEGLTTDELVAASSAPEPMGRLERLYNIVYTVRKRNSGVSA